jgi:hypothetical protein
VWSDVKPLTTWLLHHLLWIVSSPMYLPDQLAIERHNRNNTRNSTTEIADNSVRKQSDGQDGTTGNVMGMDMPCSRKA